MHTETCLGHDEGSEGRVPRGGDTELDLKCCMRFCQSSKRIQREQRHGGQKQPAGLVATRSGSVCFGIKMKAAVGGGGGAMFEMLRFL